MVLKNEACGGSFTVAAVNLPYEDFIEWCCPTFLQNLHYSAETWFGLNRHTYYWWLEELYSVWKLQIFMSLSDVVTMKTVDSCFICVSGAGIQNSKDCLFLFNIKEDMHNCLISRQN